jgi:CBS domain containing-hemolysin-like protein
VSGLEVLAVAAEDVVDASFSLTAVVIGVVLLLANGFFVAVEIALLAARRGRIEEAAEAGDPRARRALKALTELSVTFSGAQLGITMCSLGLGAIAEPALAALFADLLGPAGLPPGVVPVIAVVAALSITVFLHMVVGEMAPKNLAIARAERVSLALARPFGWFVTLLRPLILLLNGVANGLVRLVRVEPVDEHKLVHSPQELALVLAESEDVGTIAPQDARVMDAALRLSSMDAEAAMTPRVDLHAVPDTAALPDLLAVARGSGHTRIPVYNEDIDHVVGLVHVKDVLIRDDVEDPGVGVVELLRPIPAVPESRDLEQLLRDMLDERSHAVLVVDEFGGTAGLLTLEDLLEELVGEIADEFDDEEAALPGTDRTWVVAGTLRRDEASRTTGVNLEGGDAETVSGWIVERLGRLPEAGDRVQTEDGWQLTVRDVAGRRAGEVEVRAPRSTTAEETGSGGRADDAGP